MTDWELVKEKLIDRILIDRDIVFIQVINDSTRHVHIHIALVNLGDRISVNFSVPKNEIHQHMSEKKMKLGEYSGFYRCSTVLQWMEKAGKHDGR